MAYNLNITITSHYKHHFYLTVKQIQEDIDEYTTTF